MNRLIFAGLVALVFFTVAGRGIPANVKCCHGCGQYHCKKANCGDNCQQGPNCRGCWTDCKTQFEGKL
jgi:hypothetical protein